MCTHMLLEGTWTHSDWMLTFVQEYDSKNEEGHKVGILLNENINLKMLSLNHFWGFYYLVCKI